MKPTAPSGAPVNFRQLGAPFTNESETPIIASLTHPSDYRPGPATNLARIIPEFIDGPARFIKLLVGGLRLGGISFWLVALAATSTRLAGQGVTPLVPLASVDSTIVQEMRYATTNNFVGEVIDGYEAPVCMLTEPAARALSAVQRDLLARGLSLKVYDCYRPQRGVNHFIRWARDTADTRMKSRFYPDIPKSRLFELGYIARRSGHSRGSTVDLTIVPADAPPPTARTTNLHADCRGPGGERYPDDGLEMGTGYDCFDELAHTANADVSAEAHENRMLLKAAMERHGFNNYRREWWHYTLADEPYPDRYFDIPVRGR